MTMESSTNHLHVAHAGAAPKREEAMIPASLDPAWLRDKLVVSGVPRHMHEGYVRYLFEGRTSPDSFLYAVLTNDLRNAYICADDINRRALYQHVAFLVNHAPAAAWGSPDRVTAWIQSFIPERTV